MRRVERATLRQFLQLLLCSLSVAAETRSVNTGWGILRGEVVSPQVDDLPPVAQYLGVPYGVSPSGQYRFNMAISAAKWINAAKDARQLQAVCMQTALPELSVNRAFAFTSAQRFDYTHKLFPQLKKQSEDCLYMNLYVPERLDSNIREANLAVLVIVHGDEYGWNSGNPYNGTILAAYGQVIVITINYRLGVFGFLGHCEANSCTGNSGISDIVSALKMLNGILPAFGGDPKAVTLMGWGSGASLVSLLMASPLTQPSRRLFQRAVLLDGSALSPWAISTQPQQVFMQLAEKLSCAGKNTTKSFNYGVAQILRCMQDHSAANVTRAAQKIEVPTFLSGFAPIIDGQLIPNQPKLSFSSEFGSLFREIDLLVGTTNHPAHHLLSNEDITNGLNASKREKILRTLVRNLFDYHRQEIYAALLNEYTDWENPQDHPKSIRNSVLAALSDVLFTAPLVETMRLHASDEYGKQGKTFMFVFAHETRSWSNEQPNSGIRGSLSGDHLPYLLGFPLMQGHQEDSIYSGFSNEDKDISRVMMHYLANFIKSGEPSRPYAMRKTSSIEERFNSVAWPQFNLPNREAYLEITDRPKIKNFYRNQFVAFWNGLVPKLHGTRQDEVDVPEEHHFLTRHFAKDSFFGKVRQFGHFANHPFPPPPMPPSPPPKDFKKPTPPPIPDSTFSPTIAPVSNAQYYGSALAYILVIGTGMLLLNICVLIMICRQCDKTKNSKKKLQLQYQTYASSHVPANDMIVGLNSPLQEPLLAGSQKTSTTLRQGISPTCPRHGRAAIALQGSRGNSVVSAGTGPPPLEEIQV